ncbi:MAG: twin-arginine translocation signal domain-containing protein, partial [Chloroflexi bacterium]|nr:twin-arginine translocation signal domain-containing protein [Chloroflexota bacterium]
MNTLKHCNITRRDFLKGTAATSVALWYLTNVPAPALARGDNALAADPPAVLVDLTRCVGCDSCALACKEANGLPQGPEPPRHLDEDTYTYVAEFHVVNRNNE